MKKITIIKYGTNTLIEKKPVEKVSIDYDNIHNHGAILNQIDNPVILVSSGAVAFGMVYEDGFEYISDEVIKKRVLAAIGNPGLSTAWNAAIPDKLILQSLITHRDLISPDSKEKISELISVLYKKNNTVIQVNDNDFITDEELKGIRGGDFGDNDQITALIVDLCGSIFEEVEVIINTSSDGVLEKGVTIPVVKKEDLTDEYIHELCGSEKTDLGTGGMGSKLKMVREMVASVDNCSVVHIINGKKPEQLQSVLDGGHAGTRIIL